ncbi:10602_t:CDS:1 [Ambispora leptoticha]|uniref:10602_t:CDS:1 n=1 Tax=Ambispora leptoticha TaxID=144679 RepID=A0A9N9AZT8_9GLOM|nr:10602_t:CDS:1 [Ambispora leptoticha]
MINRDLIQFLITISIPFLLQKVLEYLRRRNSSSYNIHQNNQQKKHEPTRAEYSVTALLILTVLYHLYYLLISVPENIFSTLRVPLRTPTTQLKFLLGTASKRYTQPVIDTLSTKFASLENRYLYTTYGHEAFLDCIYCRDATDYFYYILPKITFSYVVMVAIMGLATMLRRKQDYRTYSVVFLVVCGAFDIYSYATLDLRLLISNSAISVDYYHYSTADFYRRLAFLGVSFAILILNRTDVRTEAEILLDLQRSQEYVIARLKGATLQRAAILRDTGLRKTFVDYYKRVEVEEGVIHSDPEYKKARAAALAKLNVENLTRDAELYVENLTKVRESEGISTHRERNDMYRAVATNSTLVGGGALSNENDIGGL